MFRGRQRRADQGPLARRHGMSLYAKRLERGRFIWPSPADGVVTITPAQLGYMLEGIDWRKPRHHVAAERPAELDEAIAH